MAVTLTYPTWSAYFMRWANDEIDREFRHEEYLAVWKPTYVIGCHETALVKIGTSTHPQRRLKELQAGSPTTLELICHLDVDEFQAHVDLSDHRKHGEWFEWRPNVRGYVEKHRVGSDWRPS